MSGLSPETDELTPDLTPLGHSGPPDVISVPALRIGRLTALVGVGEGRQKTTDVTSVMSTVKRRIKSS